MKEEEVRKKWLEEIAKLWPVAKGSIREVKRVCSSKTCEKCRSGERHPGWLMTYYKDGKQKSHYVPAKMQERVKLALENGRKLEALMVEAGIELIKSGKEN